MADDLGDVRELDRRALALTGEVVAAVTAADLDRPTPCAEWSIRAVSEHLVSENRGYAASSMGAPAIVSIWYSGDLRPDPPRAYHDSAAMVTNAFTAPGLHESSFEVREFGYFPAPTAIAMHFVDVLVHGWDLAVSLDVPYRPDDDLASAALHIVARWPRTGRRTREFARPVTVPATAPDFARLLGTLGRSPSWTPPAKG
ncbi:TIGR03086 family metal-binding protein [Actinophytocola oryzae]|uniref:Uncharacterized protein (TIGR03086 family) n=1 Tax=Actinophytocola oryzae TaxID=502181 RepID=A0A4V3FUU0_9PSEU|nr:TIGR03086 family metal-binding protein [Actinophytocola oryzae]TDV56501.1 uncharacterized protein (TIGR03086 family) [Actinophytocola oryzae]